MAQPSFRLSDFIQEVQGRYKPEQPETFWSCETALANLVSQGLVHRWFNERLQALVADPQHVGDWRANEVVFHRGNGWTVSVALFDKPQRYIHALPFLAFYSPLSKAELAGDRYRLPDGYRHDVFDPAIRLDLDGPVAVRPREVLRLHTDRFAYDFRVPAPLPVLRFATTPLRPLEWLFSKNTLQAWQANDADLGSTQLRVAAYVLGRIAHQSSIGPLRDLSRHPHHAVRWAAIQNLGRLNRTEALTKIREAVNDPHPHIRRAAQKTLDQMQAQK